MLKLNDGFIKNYDEDSSMGSMGYVFEADVKYPKRLHNLHCDLQLLPDRMKINKFNKLVCILYDKNNYVVHIRALKQALDHEIILKKVHEVIQCN